MKNSFFFLRPNLYIILKKKKGIPVRNEIFFFSFLFPFTYEINWYFLDLYPSGLTGLEPAASALTGRCSDRLNYNPRNCSRKKWHSILMDFVGGLSKTVEVIQFGWLLIGWRSQRILFLSRAVFYCEVGGDLH